jgi:hypothetical protein
MNPTLKKPTVVGSLGGVAASASVFAFCIWASTWDAVSPVSLTLSFRPWWRASNWIAAALSFAVVAVVLAARAASRPRKKAKT